MMSLPDCSMLILGVCVSSNVPSGGFLSGRPPRWRPHYGDEQMVHMLLESFFCSIIAIVVDW